MKNIFRFLIGIFVFFLVLFLVGLALLLFSPLILGIALLTLGLFIVGGILVLLLIFFSFIWYLAREEKPLKTDNNYSLDQGKEIK